MARSAHITLGVIMNFSFDSIYKFLASAGLVAIGACFSIWQVSNDKVVAALANANAAYAEASLLSGQYGVLSTATAAIYQSADKQLSETKQLAAAGNAADALSSINRTTALRQQMGVQLGQMRELQSQIDKKHVEAVRLSAFAATVRDGQTSKTLLCAFGAAAGVLLFVVGGIGWARVSKTGPSTPYPKLKSRE